MDDGRPARRAPRGRRRANRPRRADHAPDRGRPLHPACRADAGLHPVLPRPPGGPIPSPCVLRLDRGWLWVAVTPGTHAQAPIEVIAGPARVAVRDGGVGFRLNRDGSVIVRTYHGLAVVRRARPPAATWERSLPELQEVLVPAVGTASREPQDHQGGGGGAVGAVERGAGLRRLRRQGAGAVREGNLFG